MYLLYIEKKNRTNPLRIIVCLMESQDEISSFRFLQLQAWIEAVEEVQCSKNGKKCNNTWFLIWVIES